VEQRGSERYSNFGYDEHIEGIVSSNETTPLLGSQTAFTYTSSGYQANGSPGSAVVSDGRLTKNTVSFSQSFLRVFRKDVKARFKKEVVQVPSYGLTAVRAIPAVLLGCLLNILDGVSCELYFLNHFSFEILHGVPLFYQIP
jgi:hypothetical protein